MTYLRSWARIRAGSAPLALLAATVGCGPAPSPQSPPAPPPAEVAPEPATVTADRTEEKALSDPAATAAEPTAAEPAPAASALPPASAPPSPAQQEQLDRAVSFERTRDLPAAIGILREAERAHGPHAVLRLASARLHLLLAEEALGRGEDKFLVKGLVADAHLRAQQAAEMDPRVPGLVTLTARILRFEEDPDGAQRLLLAHVAEHPADAAAHRELGEMARNRQEWEDADRHFTRVAEIDPTDGRARLEATIAKQWLGVPAAELARGYLAAARLLPEDDAPLRLLASLSSDRARQAELLAKVVEENPRAVWARVWWAHVLRSGDAPDLATSRRVLEEARAIAPAQTAVRFNLAQVLEQAGEHGAAVEEYLAAVEHGEEGAVVPASDALERMLHLGPGADAVALPLRVRAYNALVAKNPTDGRYANNAGLWFRDQGKDYDESLRYYQAAVATQPQDQDYLNDTGLLYLFHLTDQKELSLPYFNQVVELVEVDGHAPTRGYWDALENLCRYWFEKREWAKVVECARKRADPAAAVDGRPYPSGRAAATGAEAQRQLDAAR